MISDYYILRDKGPSTSSGDEIHTREQKTAVEEWIASRRPELANTVIKMWRSAETRHAASSPHKGLTCQTPSWDNLPSRAAGRSWERLLRSTLFPLVVSCSQSSNLSLSLSFNFLFFFLSLLLTLIPVFPSLSLCSSSVPIPFFPTL